LALNPSTVIRRSALERGAARARALAAAAAITFASALTIDARADGGDEAGQMPYAIPRETLIPGTPGMPGGLHVMVNAFAHAQNAGLGAHRIDNGIGLRYPGGATVPIVDDDWAMAYARDAGGWVEGLLMLNLEPLTIGPGGYPEVGQSGEGLYDAQHAHQLLHQAMIAVHPLSSIPGWHPEGMMHEGAYDLSVFAGQGSATIGPPIFMHRASSPGPTVPRKHHKGENPHETFPVIGTSLRVHDTWFEASAFSALELTPDDTRFTPHVAAPASFAARVRRVFGGWLELQVSAERLRDQAPDEPDAFQASASAYAWGDVGGVRLDGLLDWAIDAPDRVAGEDRHTAQALLGEIAVRSSNRREIVWARTELNQREEPAARGGGVSSPWIFQTLGFEHVALGGVSSGLQLGLFGEGTVIAIPSSLEGFYGTTTAVTLNVGIHLFGMWMLDGHLRPMHHGAM